MRSYNLNEKVVVDYFVKKNQKTLYIYSVVSLLTAGLGYIEKNQLTQKLKEFCSISSSTAKRWISQLYTHKLIRIRKGIIYPTGRKKMESENPDTQRYIRCREEHLKSYFVFQNHIIVQIALLCQIRFRYAWIKNFREKNAASDPTSGIIEATLDRVNSPNKVGCSISKVQEILQLSKGRISVALQGNVEKQSNCKKELKGYIARKKYGSLLNTISNKGSHYKDPRFTYEYDSLKDTYIICYALASKIIAPSFLVKRKYRA